MYAVSDYARVQQVLRQTPLTMRAALAASRTPVVLAAAESVSVRMRDVPAPVTTVPSAP